MSQGARNWPFFTLTTRPVLRRGDQQIGLPAQERRDLQHVDRLARPRAHCAASCTSVSTGTPSVCADLGEDRQRRVEPDAARAPARWCGSPCRTRSCRRGRCRAARRSPSAPPPSRAHARGSRARTARRSAPAAARCRTARFRRRRSDWALVRQRCSWPATLRRRCRRVNRRTDMGNLAGHIRRAHGAVVAKRRQHGEYLFDRPRARALRNASSGVARGSSTTRSASWPGASVPSLSSSASARAPPSVAR